MKTFVTGATRFIGTRVVRQLIEKGHERPCLVRRTSNTHELEKMGAALVTGDVSDRASLTEGMDGLPRRRRGNSAKDSQ